MTESSGSIDRGKQRRRVSDERLIMRLITRKSGSPAWAAAEAELLKRDRENSQTSGWLSVAVALASLCIAVGFVFAAIRILAFFVGGTA